MTPKTTSELAQIFNVTRKSVHSWIRDGMPVLVEGVRGAGKEAQVDLEAAVRWYFERQSIHKLDAVAERARRDKEAADKLALENAETRGEVGRLDEMEAWFGGHVERAQARLIQIPDALAQFCDPRVAPIVVSEARRLIYEALAELAGDDVGNHRC